MRQARVISISLPPPLTETLKRVAAHERRSISEVVREAVRAYLTANNHELPEFGASVKHRKKANADQMQRKLNLTEPQKPQSVVRRQEQERP